MYIFVPFALIQPPCTYTYALQGYFPFKTFAHCFVFTHFTFPHVDKMCNKVGMDAIRVRKFYLADIKCGWLADCLPTHLATMACSHV